ncbi:stage II sporulation protein M [Luteimicrobium sp. DT211]|uniref:stage II sporulation protein M n=1 Tax=Luteimicrobium sp. DT211 TaxID=3393412 RepID=UPI003CEEF4D6
MDLDALTAARADQWARLDELARRRRLDGAEADELARLYQSVATDLSTIRSTAPDPTAVANLSGSLARARARLAGAHEPAWSDVARFAVVTAPAALYRIRWWIVGVAAASIVVAVVVGWWVATDDGALAALGPKSARDKYALHDFSDYYAPSSTFASVVWTNNAWLSALCVALGITGIGPAWVLFTNAVNVGSVAGLMATYGRLDDFFASILPHGMLELTALFTAGAAGLRIFWTLVDPGPRPRSRALAEEGRSLLTVAITLVVALAVSGLIEGFVTGSGLPTWVKLGIGAVALAAFWAYVLVLGGRAARAGETGDVDVERGGDVRPVAA